jgi:glycosyltransferase involved in cell wall biosynthesis
MPDIPVSVIVMTRNEAARISRCLAALKDFDEVIVVDSASSDGTAALAGKAASVVPFAWNGKYPKKKQWCLDNLRLKHDWVFLVDADEEVTPALRAEMASLFGNGTPSCAGYFVRGRYVADGKVLRFGLCNGKLALFDRRLISFPVVDDIGLLGMGEVEGHYQPVLKAEFMDLKIGGLKNALLHHAYEGGEGWQERHRRYAAWEAGMNARSAWPRDPIPAREILKRIFRRLPARGVVAFAHSYFFRLGFLDGQKGFDLARGRWRYYRMIAAASSTGPARAAAKT